MFEFCWLSSIYKGFMSPRIVESCKVSFQNDSFNITVVSLSIFFKHTKNLIAQHSIDTSIFSEYSATHYRAIHECSASYARFFFFLRVNCCEHLLLHSHAFYRQRKSFSPLSVLTIIRCRGASTYFQVTSCILHLIRHTMVDMRSLES